MTNEEKAKLLVARVEALALKTKVSHQKQKTCSECGKSFLGIASSTTCGDKCRQRKSRG